jgi:hypothetical protein
MRAENINKFLENFKLKFIRKRQIVRQQKVGWTKVERISKPEQKIDDLLSQGLASKIYGLQFEG